MSQIYDFLENAFLLRPEADEQIPPAENGNTLGKVPDSSWLTNRVGREPVSVGDLAAGPNQGDGPHLGQPWLIIGVKSQGVTPGFTIRDARGATYFIKFDPPGHPQLSTSSEANLEWKPAIRSALTLGIWDRPWRHVNFPDYPAIGRFESEFFDPGKWKPEYPNAAFDRMLPADAFWAAKIIAHLDDEKIRAMVSTGQIFDPEAEEYLVRTLIRRRDKILRYYFSRLNPLASFRVNAEGDSVSAIHFGIQAGLAKACSYRFRWFRYDNVSGRRLTLSGARTADRSEFQIPEPCLTRWAFLLLQVASVHPEFPEWAQNVDVYVRCDGTPTVVGVEPESVDRGTTDVASR